MLPPPPPRRGAMIAVIETFMGGGSGFEDVYINARVIRYKLRAFEDNLRQHTRREPSFKLFASTIKRTTAFLGPWLCLAAGCFWSSQGAFVGPSL
jgi:hypothetical protein